MKKIGIPIDIGENRYAINIKYIEFIDKAGYHPVLITPNETLTDEYVKTFDGLLLPGGIDVDPTHYNEENIESYHCNLDKDDFERIILNKFLKHKKPVFGICRGFQLLFREMNETWKKEVQDNFHYFQDIDGHSMVSSLHLNRGARSHFVKVNRTKLFGKDSMFESDHVLVNSMHHQAVYTSYPNPLKSDISNFDIIAVTDRGLDAKCKGRIVEGFTGTLKDTKIKALQWHPEELKDTSVLTSFFG